MPNVFVAESHIFLSDASRVSVSASACLLGCLLYCCCCVCTQVVFSYYCYYFSISTYTFAHVSTDVCMCVCISICTRCMYDATLLCEILKFIAAILYKMLVIIVYPCSILPLPLLLLLLPPPCLCVPYNCCVCLPLRFAVIAVAQFDRYIYSYPYICTNLCISTNLSELTHIHTHSHTYSRIAFACFIILYLCQSILL